MNKSFCKLGTNLNIPWSDIDIAINGITEEFTNKINSYEVFVAPIKGAYWQYYPYTRTRFTRNFGATYKQVAMSIVECLKNLQSTVKKENFADLRMYESLISHTFDYKRVQLIKAVAGVDTLPHIDNGREFVINIGLKNSNTCTTYISDCSNAKDFWLQNPSSFTINDCEAYLINADNMHAVKSLVSSDSKLDRYLATYMLTQC